MRWTATDLDGRDFEKSHAAGSDRETVTPTIHLTLQGKGGVGKSLVAAILAQFFRHRGAEIHCLDTDPVNHELAHEMLHHKKDGPPLTKLVRET